MTEYQEVLKLLKTKSQNHIFSIYNHEIKKKENVGLSEVIPFWKLYCDAYYMKDSSKWNESPVFSLSEISNNYIPVIGEFLFKFDINKQLDDKYTDLLYQKELVTSITNVYQTVIKELFFLSSKNSELVCVVSETPVWIESNKLNIKIKFQFPYCKTDKRYISGIFRTRILQQLRQSRINNYFTKSSPLGDWQTQLEEVKDYYPLYGSNEALKRPPVFFIGVYNDKCQEIPINKSYKYKHHSFISNERCVVDDVDCFDDGDMDEQEFHMYLLPLFLSIDFFSGITRVKDDPGSGIMSGTGSIISDENDEYEFEDPNDFTICLELIGMLEDFRFSEEVYFMDIGKALYKSTNGEEEGLNEWINLTGSKKCKFDRNFCELKYENFEQEETTVKTIAWYARIDNRDKYDSWHESWCRSKLFRALEGKHVIVAEAFYRVFWLEYMYTGKKWIEFRRNRLTILQEDFSIRKKITNNFIPCFDKLRSQISEEKLRLNKGLGKSQNTREKINDLEKQIIDVGKLIDKLLSETFRGPLVRSMKEYFYKENLIKILNKNPSLTGAGNCIIEMTDKKAITRPGKPEDYVTKRLGVSYRSDYSFKHPDIKDLLKYFEQVFPEPTINHHMKKDLSSYLYGRNAEKYFRIWIGDTNGSKSVYQKMLRTMMGDYYCDLPSTYFSAGQKGGSGPNPELAQTDGARIAFSAEPDDDMSFKGARIKRITGGDSFFARSCGEDGGTIETSFKVITVCNGMPDISGNDEATKNRCCMTPMEGRWIKPGENFHVPKNHDEQVKAKTYTMDERFEDNIPKLAGALLWLAVYYYKIYREEGLIPPSYVKTFMKEYWTKHDPHVSFISEMLENAKTPEGEIDMTKYITATDIYPVYKRWWRESYPQSQVLPKPKMIEILSTPDKLKKQKERRWYGVVVRKQAPPDIAEY